MKIWCEFLMMVVGLGIVFKCSVLVFVVGVNRVISL